LGFGLLFLALFRDRLLPAADVEVAVVLATAGEASTAVASAAADGGMVFQASGWIEPDPLPIKASALIDGVIDKVEVLEGAAVEQGAVLATLVDDDARLELAVAEGKLRVLTSARDAHCGGIETARQQLVGAKAAVAAAQAMEDEAADLHARLVKLPKGTSSEVEVVAARLRLARESAARAVAEARIGEIDATLKQLDLETRAREEEMAAAAIAVQQAALTLKRTRVTAPVAGRVLRLLAAPGQKRMLGMDEENSSTIAILYQPDHLQVRVDVPLADAAGLQVGQQARIRCSILPDRVFRGEVTRITGEADLQRNTLQAKVRILDPIELLRPEMLCRVEFLGAAKSAGSVLEVASGELATWIPAAALRDAAVWICDPESKRVMRRPVRPSDELRDGYRRILEGLRPGEWVVLAPADLTDEQRVNPHLFKP
jgi:RND family efflux transporter MFP subunit